jgi:hypothetical protein
MPRKGMLQGVWGSRVWGDRRRQAAERGAAIRERDAGFAIINPDEGQHLSAPQTPTGRSGVPVGGLRRSRVGRSGGWRSRESGISGSTPTNSPTLVANPRPGSLCRPAPTA